MTSLKSIMFCTANCFSVSKHYSKSEGYVICFLLNFSSFYTSPSFAMYGCMVVHVNANV